MHVEHLLVDDQKMSKSLGNVFTLSDLLERGYRPSAVRYLLLSAHYRKQLNFTWASLAQMEESLRRLTDFLTRLEAVSASGTNAAVAAKVQEAEVEFAKTGATRQEVEFGVQNVDPGASFSFVIDGVDVASAMSDRRGRADVELDVRLP
jgi:cysteinyl-tRNA synthetase